MSFTPTTGSEVSGDKPAWLVCALKYLGEREVKGRFHNPLILRWWKAVKAIFTDDETPWCAAFVGGVLAEAGITPKYSAAARSYLTWGRPVAPRVGAIAVLWRGHPSSGQGHVGFVVGRDKNGNILLLGGNQGDAVTVSSFPTLRVLGYRWPEGVAVPQLNGLIVGISHLPIYDGAKLSTSEA